MNIAVDAFPLKTVNSSGVSNYIKRILLRMLDMNTEKFYYLYAKNINDFPIIKNCAVRHASSSSRGTSYENTLWLFTEGVRKMKKDNIDIFWGTRQMLPPYLPAGIRKVLIVYDLVWHFFPGTMDTYNLLVSKIICKYSIKKADHIITISEATAQALTETLKVSREKISIIYPAADEYIPLNKLTSASYIARKYDVSNKYILTVSTVEPRKNLRTLLKVFAKLRSSGYQLLIAGSPGWKTTSIYREVNSLGFTEKEIRFLGFIPDGDMNTLYSGASLFVFPSLYEGFGIPPLEAMASGTPVIVSNSSSLPEVVGNACISVDPYDCDGWATAISQVLSDEVIRETSIAGGLERARMFSWDKSAGQTLTVFEQLIN